MTCEHKFGFKKRESGEVYCPVCRGTIYQEDIKDVIKDGSNWWENSKGKKNEHS